MEARNRFSIDKKSGCWYWNGSAIKRLNKSEGHGMVKIDGNNWLVHRLIYTIFYGPIPSGFDVHHTCEIPNCFNPEHLKLKEHGEHQRHHKRKVYCKRGHPRTRENVSIRKDGGIVCKACRRDRWKAKKILSITSGTLNTDKPCLVLQEN